MPNTYAGYSLYGNDTYSNGMVGTVSDDGSTVVTSPNLQTLGLNGDPTAQGFIDGSDLRLAVTDDPSSSVNIYDPSTGSSIATGLTWSGVKNLYAVVPFGSYFYALDFDSASVIELDSSYSETGNSFTLSSHIPSGYTQYGQALFMANGDLYGLFIFYNTSTYPPTFANSLLIKFTVNPGPPISGGSITFGSNDYNSGLAPNTIGLVFDGSQHLYTAAIGGGQSSTYNPSSAIQQIDLTTANLSTATVTTLLNGATTHTDYLDISMDGAGTFYILSGLYDSSFSTLSGFLQSTPRLSSPSWTTIDTISAGGFCWAAQWTPENSRIWEARGNEIWIYDATASPVSTVATLSTASGTPTGWKLVSASEPHLFNTLNNFSYVGASSSFAKRGATSPIQASNQSWARKARAITKGRPFLTKEEFDRLQRELGVE